MKARMIVDKSPFVATDGIIFTGHKSSRLLGVDISNGRLLHDSNNEDIQLLHNHAGKGKQPSMKNKAPSQNKTNKGRNKNTEESGDGYNINGKVHSDKSIIVTGDSISDLINTDENEINEESMLDDPSTPIEVTEGEPKETLWLGRVDYTVRAFDGETGTEKVFMYAYPYHVGL